MDQLTLHKSLINPPPRLRKHPPIVEKFISAYKIWHECLGKFPKTSKFPLGSRIDNVFIAIFEDLFSATYEAKGKKLAHIQSALARFDLMKFLLHLAWEIRALSTKQYAHLSKPLDEIGKMLGGWRKHLDAP